MESELGNDTRDRDPSYPNKFILGVASQGNHTGVQRLERLNRSIKGPCCLGAIVCITHNFHPKLFQERRAAKYQYEGREPLRKTPRLAQLRKFLPRTRRSQALRELGGPICVLAGHIDAFCQTSLAVGIPKGQ